MMMKSRKNLKKKSETVPLSELKSVGQLTFWMDGRKEQRRTSIRPTSQSLVTKYRRQCVEAGINGRFTKLYGRDRLARDWRGREQASKQASKLAGRLAGKLHHTVVKRGDGDWPGFDFDKEKFLFSILLLHSHHFTTWTTGRRADCGASSCGTPAHSGPPESPCKYRITKIKLPWNCVASPACVPHVTWKQLPLPSICH
ncbi:hypothetical protein T11_9748 [Trichinella zimbabwensis]|uniref:Uncharacterized protein n=1 Tax=Trichinella zimbabwensis TaxID=268475 RepID=A0A0V1I0G0_9BILA|nr:hypothetical protein T11_9748 [Trichinella zimbabwensis]